jgi:hypothetical protein
MSDAPTGEESDYLEIVDPGVEIQPMEPVQIEEAILRQHAAAVKKRRKSLMYGSMHGSIMAVMRGGKKGLSLYLKDLSLTRKKNVFRLKDAIK